MCHLSGYYFLNEINAVPSLVGSARTMQRAIDDMGGAVKGYFKVSYHTTKGCCGVVICTQGFLNQLTDRSVDVGTNRADDVVYSLPGP